MNPMRWRLNRVGVPARVEQRDRRALRDPEARVAQQRGQGLGQVRVGQVLVPGREHAAHPRVVTGAPHDRGPVGVEHGQAALRAQDPVGLGQRPRQVGHVLVDLGGDDDVERRVLERQRGGIAGHEGHRRGVVGQLAGPGQREHALARLQPVHRAHGPSAAAISAASNPGPDADVEHALAGRQPQRLEHQPPLLDDVGGAVGRLDAARLGVVELEHACRLNPLRVPLVGPDARTRSGRRSRRPRPASRSRPHGPAQRDVAGLHEPVGRQRLRDVMQEPAGDREPRAAEQREQRRSRRRAPGRSSRW